MRHTLGLDMFVLSSAYRALLNRSCHRVDHYPPGRFGRLLDEIACEKNTVPEITVRPLTWAAGTTT